MFPIKKKLNLPLIEILIASFVIHLLVLLLLGGVTLFHNLVFPDPDFEAPPTETAQPPPISIPIQITKMKPAAPRDIKVIQLQDIDVAKLDVQIPVVSQRIGVSGSGYGSGVGNGLGGGAIDLGKLMSFAGIEDRSERVCYIVDFSLSMHERIKGSKVSRLDLLKKQLLTSLENLDDQMMVSLIFFSGPAWVAGDTESEVRKQYSFDPEDPGFSHRPKNFALLTKPVWNRMTSQFKEELKSIVRKEKSTMGTVWGNPLRLAETLDPDPEVIYFLTDGAAGDLDIRETLKFVRDWKARNPQLRINTIALGEPKAADGMRRIANITGGKFRLIESLEDIDPPNNNS